MVQILTLSSIVMVTLTGFRAASKPRRQHAHWRLGETASNPSQLRHMVPHTRRVRCVMFTSQYRSATKEAVHIRTSIGVNFVVIAISAGRDEGMP